MKIHEDFKKYSKLKDVGRWHITRFVSGVAKQLPSNSLILDAGAGECVYRSLFAHCNYRSIDLAVGEQAWNYGNLDYIAPLHNMPIDDGIFDAVLCTQVLEHVELPRESIREIYRVLKVGGRLYLTAPMAHAEHQVPYDFFRYTSFGLRSLCAEAGFKDIEITPFGGMFQRWAYELPDCKSIFPALRDPNGRLQLLGLAYLPAKAAVHLLVRCLQFFLIHIDFLDRKKNFPFGWSVTAEKQIK